MARGHRYGLSKRVVNIMRSKENSCSEQGYTKNLFPIALESLNSNNKTD
jgi:hypothetical protein